MRQQAECNALQGLLESGVLNARVSQLRIGLVELATT